MADVSNLDELVHELVSRARVRGASSWDDVASVAVELPEIGIMLTTQRGSAEAQSVLLHAHRVLQGQLHQGQLHLASDRTAAISRGSTSSQMEVTASELYTLLEEGLEEAEGWRVESSGDDYDPLSSDQDVHIFNGVQPVQEP